MIATLAAASLITAAPAAAPETRAWTLGTGTYRVIWDDLVDDKVEGDKNCDIVIRVQGSRMTGSFRRLSDGRSASLEGDIYLSGEHALTSFRQVEDGYFCGYQLVTGPQPTIHMGGREAPPVYRGVWQDSKGRRGDFALFRYQ